MFLVWTLILPKKDPPQTTIPIYSERVGTMCALRFIKGITLI